MDLWLYFLPLSSVKFEQAALEPTKATLTSVTAEDMRRCEYGHHPSQSRQHSCTFWEEGHSPACKEGKPTLGSATGVSWSGVHRETLTWVY